MFSFRAISEENLPELWPVARRYLLKVADRNKVTTLPEDVFVELRRGACSVLVLFWNGAVVGAAAVRLAPRDDGRQGVFIWALGTEPTMPKEFFQQFSDEMVSRATTVGAVSVSMTSSRPGWGRFIRQFGWKPTHTTFAIEVPHV